MPEELVRVIGPEESRLNITWGGQNGDLVDPIPRDASEADVKRWATEAVRNGSVPGIPADPRADFRDFVIERNEPHEARPHHLTQLRPKTPFGRVVQKITLVIEGTQPYSFGEKRPQGSYQALQHFFEDIGFKMLEMDIERLKLEDK